MIKSADWGYCKMQLSQQESKYRKRFFATEHLRKDAQRYIDEQVRLGEVTYKDLYNEIYPPHFWNIMNTRLMARAITKASVTAQRAARAFQHFAACVKEVTE